MSIQVNKKTLGRIYGKEPRQTDALARRIAPWADRQAVLKQILKKKFPAGRNPGFARKGVWSG